VKWKKAPLGASSTDSAPVPVVLPHLVVTISDEGALVASLAGQPYEVSPALGTGRAGVGGLLGEVTERLGTPVRVEVREADGTVFTEVVVPRRPQTDISRSAPVPTATVGSNGGTRLQVAGGGFDPDEEVAVAVVVAHQHAGPDGSAQLRLPASLLDGRPGMVVLVGCSSGAIALSGGRV